MDNESESTWRLNARQLGDLLSLGKTGKAPKPGSKGRALEQMLASLISLNPAEPGSISQVLGRPCDELRACAGRTVAEAVLGGQAEAAALETLKNYGKKLAKKGDSEANRAAAAALYYTAIAAALVFHARKITELSFDKLKKGLTELESRNWVTADVKALLARAREKCQPEPD
jgi:hypothetical protein